MAFNVRVFAYNGLAQLFVSNQHRLSDDSVWVCEEPPVWSQLAVTNAATPVSITFPGPGVDTAKVLAIEITDGQQIRYEVQLLGPTASNARIPGNLSRRMSGLDYITWTAGATFSFVEAASFP
jgi:hypothetical protein